jgi:hypothetical protein
MERTSLHISNTDICGNSEAALALTNDSPSSFNAIGEFGCELATGDDNAQRVYQFETEFAEGINLRDRVASRMFIRLWIGSANISYNYNFCDGWLFDDCFGTELAVFNTAGLSRVSCGPGHHHKPYITKSA